MAPVSRRPPVQRAWPSIRRFVRAAAAPCASSRPSRVADLARIPHEQRPPAFRPGSSRPARRGPAGCNALRSARFRNHQADHRRCDPARATMVPGHARRPADRLHPSACSHQGCGRSAPRSFEDRSGSTNPIGSRAGAFVQSGFNEVAHGASHHRHSRATSQNLQIPRDRGQQFQANVGSDSTGSWAPLQRV